MKAGFALAALAAATTALAATPPVTVKGNAFFVGDKRFYVRGVDYQPGGSSELADPITDVEGCKRDVEKFKQLGVNTIRVYSIDNSKNHDQCMKLLSDAGIYLVLDVNTPDYSLNRKDVHPSYNAVYLQHVFATVDIFAQYDNTLAFFSANEVIDDSKTTECAPYVKAVTRDIRNYLKARDYRRVPVGYSAADIDTNRLEMAEYMNCGPEEERSDFFAFNDYSWCDPSDFETSGWDQKVKNFTGYGLPLFLSEFGCNTNTREFNEIKSLYSEDMTAVYSGGMVYEYTMEPNKYGLVEVNGKTVKELDDFKTLKKAYADTPNASGDGGYNKTGGASGCPARSSNWQVTGSKLPTMPRQAEKYMEDGAGKGPGFNGDGSQWAADSASPDAGPSSTTSGDDDDDDSSSGSDGDSAATMSMPAQPLFLGIALMLTTFAGAAML